MPKGRKAGFTQIQKAYSAFAFAETHRIYKAAYIAAGSPAKPDKFKGCYYLQWAFENKVPLKILTQEQWLAAHPPVIPNNPFDDDDMWAEAMAQLRYLTEEANNLEWRYF